MRIRDWPIIRNIWPQFFSHEKNVHLDSFYTFSNYTLIWVMGIYTMAIASIAPLILVTIIHYQLIQRSVDSELLLRAERLTSNAKRSVVFFINERLDALTFTVNEMGFENLADNEKLTEIFNNLKFGFGGITDLSVIDSNGNQIAYAGPFNLEGKNYKTQPWFIQSLKKDNFVSDVFTGYRNAPHIIIAVRSKTKDNSSFILRATLDTQRLMQVLSSYRTSAHTDVFLLNRDGVLQTPSLNFGNIFKQSPLPVPKFSLRTKVKSAAENGGEKKTLIMGYSYISTDIAQTPFILMVLKQKEGVMHTWLNIGKTFNWIIGISIIIIIVIITILATVMVNKLYVADNTKAQTMLQMEQSQQLASIGQLAAGVAHEINNPLALVNETAGYLKDVYRFDSEQTSDAEIIEHLDSILEAVDRCGAITSQLLGFVRQFDITVKKINVGDMLNSVMSFHKKEAEYRNISINISVPELPLIIETDSGKLQQILVNIVNNAFQAIDGDGRIDIIASLNISNTIEISIKDTGCGISEENLKKIHEPFFSTKKEKMGTGLGLSITYGLVKKLQGNIYVESNEGVGTIFTIKLPIKIEESDLA